MHLIFECIRRYRDYQDRFDDTATSNSNENINGADNSNSHLVLNLQQLRDLQEQQIQRLMNNANQREGSGTGSGGDDRGSGSSSGNGGGRGTSGSFRRSEIDSIVYGVPSVPSTGRVIGYYNEESQSFEIDENAEEVINNPHTNIADDSMPDVTIGVPIIYGV